MGKITSVLKLTSKLTIKIIFGSLCIFIFSVNSMAWGPRGHHGVCAVATRLVQNEKLRDFLKARADEMGYLCNIPDIYWKSLGELSKKNGYPSHYINPESIGKTIETMPLKFSEVLRLALEKNLPDPHTKTGSVWWRVEQFFNLALEKAKDVDKALQKKSNSEYEDHIFAMVEYMGLMGHYVGDSVMPYHNSKDYDGWDVGHGGIHNYYEVLVLDELSLDYQLKVYNQAIKFIKQKLFNKNYQKKSIVEKMQFISALSIKEKSIVERLDPIISASVGDNQNKKEKATRKPPNLVAQKFESLIVRESARAALALAEFWNEIYKQAGEPDVTQYHSFKYHYMPEFIEPNYLE